MEHYPEVLFMCLEYSEFAFFPLGLLKMSFVDKVN